MDSNWILKYVMDANERDQSVQERIARADRLICDLHFAEAREELNSIRNDIRGNHPELVRLSARIDRLAGTNK
jgi:predicted Zn-dependent protease